MIKGSINQEDKTILNVYASKKRILKLMKQTVVELKGEVNEFMIILRDFNKSLSVTDGTNKQKIRKYIDLNRTIQQPDLPFTKHSTQQQKNTYSFRVHIHAFA